MIKAEPTAWLPVRRMLRIEEGIPDDFYECLNQFVRDLPTVLAGLCPRIASARVELVWPKEVVLRELQTVASLSFPIDRFCEFVRIDCELVYNLKEFQSSDPARPISPEEVLSYSASELASLIHDALILVQLAFPVRIKTENGRTYIGENALNIIERVHGFGYDLLIDCQRWPALRTLSFVEVYEWEKALGLFTKSVATTPVQRALAAYTHAVTQSITDSGEILFWSMQGIEAFYCRGTGDLRRQLAEKSRIFLGPWNETANVVGRLYDLRSKFVHGDFDLERRNSGGLPDSHEKDQELFSRASGLATRMLIATLQRCARERIGGAEFEYTLLLRHLNCETRA